MTHPTVHSARQRGVTLLELLITMIISAIALMALATPFVAERSFWGTGKRQTEAQRDAQMALRAIARVAREGLEYPVAGSGVVAIDTPCGKYPSPVADHARVIFRGGPSQGGQLKMQNFCISSTGDTSILIDGVRSRVESFTATPIVSNRLVRIQLLVAHQLYADDPRQEDELLETELFLRNGA